MSAKKLSDCLVVRGDTNCVKVLSSVLREFDGRIRVPYDGPPRLLQAFGRARHKSREPYIDAKGGFYSAFYFRDMPQGSVSELHVDHTTPCVSAAAAFVIRKFLVFECLARGDLYSLKNNAHPARSFIESLRGTGPVEYLKDLADGRMSSVQIIGGPLLHRPLPKVLRDQAKELKRFDNVWARFFVQWLVSRLRGTRLEKDVQRFQADRSSMSAEFPYFWPVQEFRPLVAEFERHLSDLGFLVL